MFGVTFEMFCNVCCFFYLQSNIRQYTHIRFLRERYPLPFAKQMTLRG